MLKIAFSSARERIAFSPQNRRARRGRGGKRFRILPSFMLPFHCKYTESIPIETWKGEKCGICCACEFNDVNVWLARDGNNGKCFEVNDDLESERFPLPRKHIYVYIFEYLEHLVSFSTVEIFFFFFFSLLYQSFHFIAANYRDLNI